MFGFICGSEMRGVAELPVAGKLQQRLDELLRFGFGSFMKEIRPLARWRLVGHGFGGVRDFGGLFERRLEGSEVRRVRGFEQDSYAFGPAQVVGAQSSVAGVGEFGGG